MDMILGWFGMTAVVIGSMTGVWWALADFILDRVGPAPNRWGRQDRI